jgi:hypothetical protein
MDLLGKIKIKQVTKMSEEQTMSSKKGKNFKEVIAEREHKGATKKSILAKITSLNVSVLYSASFLFSFIVIDALLYFALSPGVFVWAGILVVAALASTLFASRLTSLIKKNKWKYNA